MHIRRESYVIPHAGMHWSLYTQSRHRCRMFHVLTEVESVSCQNYLDELFSCAVQVHAMTQAPQQMTDWMIIASSGTTARKSAGFLLPSSTTVMPAAAATVGAPAAAIFNDSCILPWQPKVQVAVDHSSEHTPPVIPNQCSILTFLEMTPTWCIESPVCWRRQPQSKFSSSVKSCSARWHVCWVCIMLALLSCNLLWHWQVVSMHPQCSDCCGAWCRPRG